MTVRYYAEASFPWPPGRMDVDTVIDIEELPPNVRRVIREHGLDEVLGHWFEFDNLGIHTYWRVVEA